MIVSYGSNNGYIYVYSGRLQRLWALTGVGAGDVRVFILGFSLSNSPSTITGVGARFWGAETAVNFTAKNPNKRLLKPFSTKCSVFWGNVRVFFRSISAW